MVTLSPSQRQAVEASLDSLREYHWRAGVTVDSSGDVLGVFGASNRDLNWDAPKTYVTALQKALARDGLTLRFCDVDALLTEARYLDGEGLPWYTVTVPHAKIYADAAEYAREKRRRRIARLRDAGLCIVCGTAKVRDRSTCADCGRAANERTKRRKQVA